MYYDVGWNRTQKLILLNKWLHICYIGNNNSLASSLFVRVSITILCIISYSILTYINKRISIFQILSILAWFLIQFFPVIKHEFYVILLNSVSSRTKSRMENFTWAKATSKKCNAKTEISKKMRETIWIFCAFVLRFRMFQVFWHFWTFLHIFGCFSTV